MGWQSFRLDEICLVTDYVANGSFASLRENVQYLDEPDYAILVRLTDFTKGWAKGFKYVSEDAYKFLSKSSLIPGDLIMSNVGEPGKSFLLPDLGQPMTLGPNSVLIRSYTTKTSNRYLNYYFSSDLGQGQIISITSGTTQKKFNKTSFRSLTVKLPPVSEQKRIVAILDQAFADIDKARALTEQNLKNARELFESYLQQVFSQRGEGWVERRFSECFKLRSGEGLTKKDMIEGPFPVYGGNGVAGNHKEFNLSQESVIIGRVGALCGNARFINEKIWLTDNAFLVKDYKFEFDLQFLTYLLNYKKLRSLARQAAQPVISNSSLSELILEFPVDTTKQTEIKNTLDKLQAELSSVSQRYEKKIKNLDELKKSLLQKAFSGELTNSSAEAAA